MALPVLDGNQSATTLSSVVTGGEHIVAHSVVSLGSTAISNITSAVSGSVVTIPSLERIANSAATDGIADTTLNFIKIGGHQSGSNQTAHIVHVSTGGAMSVDATDSVVSISNFPSTQTIAGTVTANLPTSGAFGGGLQGYNGTNTYLNVGLQNIGGTSLNGASNLPISGTITVGNSVTIGSIPAISGTVTASLAPQAKGPVYEVDSLIPSDPKYMIMVGGLDYAGTQETRQLRTDGGGKVEVASVANSVTIGSLPAISGTVTANSNVVSIPLSAFPSEWISGGDLLKVELNTINDMSPAVWLGVDGGNVPISGTVTAAAPNGSLTTRFGTPTTANTAFATSAVTNASRKYLLIQNVTTGSNVITVGIGFTPTTTQGIQLTAGAGITFESSYIPTGAIYILSSVTASNFTILEA